VAYSQTQGTVYVSLVNLYKAMGGGWVGQAERLAENAPGTPPKR
jgi:multidrug efflux system outer membrane protein